MDTVDSEQLKQAYLKLTPQERRDVAHWILARELSGRAGASLQPTIAEKVQSSPGFPFKTVLTTVAVLVLFATLTFLGFQWMNQQEKLRKAQNKAELAAAESRRPNSPSNLEFLERNVGNEITIRGIPQDSEIGYLYFSKSRKKALRLNLFVGGVVLLQSGDLEKMIRNKHELEVQGILEKTTDGYYQISIAAQNRLKKLGP